MMRWLLFLALIFVASPSLAQWRTGAGQTCSGLNPDTAAVQRCTHAITATAATSTLDVSRCGNVTFLAQESTNPASDYTIFPQSCLVDASSETICINLITNALNGGTIYGYTQGGPLSIVRGNATVTTCAAGDCYLEVICGR